MTQLYMFASQATYLAEQNKTPDYNQGAFGGDSQSWIGLVAGNDNAGALWPYPLAFFFVLGAVSYIATRLRRGVSDRAVDEKEPALSRS